MIIRELQRDGSIKLIRIWLPCEHMVFSDGTTGVLPAACMCDRRLTEPHDNPLCPYVDPDTWYQGAVERMAERAPA